MMITERLQEAISLKGGISKIAKQSGISRAQLSRYLQGQAIPSDRLIVLARTLEISIGWLCGETSGSSKRFESHLELTRKLTERLLTRLQRFTVEKAFLPHEIARVLEFMILSQTYLQNQISEDWPLTDYDIDLGLFILNNIRESDWLDVYIDGCAYIVLHGEPGLETIWASKWVSIVEKLFARQYIKEPYITNYYLRLNIPLPPGSAHLHMMQQWVLHLTRHFHNQRIKVLDAGCGNGRHIMYLHQVSSMFEVHGIDLSPAACKICESHIQAKKLPINSITHGDFLNLPYPCESFDAYMSITNLQFIPLVKGSINEGVGQVLAEAARVLKRGGLALILVKNKGVIELFPCFHAYHLPPLLEELIKITGMRVIHREPVELKSISQPGSHFGRGVIHQEIWILQKT